MFIEKIFKILYKILNLFKRIVDIFFSKNLIGRKMLGKVYHIFHFVINVGREKLYQKITEYINGDYNNVERVPENRHLTFSEMLSGFFSNPHHIIDNIYLGSAFNACDYYKLKELNIKTIINMTPELSNYYSEEFDYLKIGVRDKNDCSLAEYYEPIYEKLNNNISNGNTFIHCYMGSSRSASGLIYYLIKKHGYTFDTAYEYINSIRSIILINKSFANELKQLSVNEIQEELKPLSINEIQEET